MTTFKVQSIGDANHRRSLVALNATDQTKPLILTGLSLTNGQPLHVAIVDASGNQVTSFGGSTIPSTLIAFVTANATAGSRTQLASNTVANGFIIEAPSTNTGLIYVGGSNVSATVFGAELQPGQSVGISVNNTNLVYIDSSINGDKAALIGS